MTDSSSIDPLPSYLTDDRVPNATGFGRLAGRVALVTGSTRGLGRTVIDWLAREGADIIVSGRAEADVEAAVSAVRGLGVRAWGIAADMSEVEEAHRLGHEALEVVGRLDILVNNAGMSIPGDFRDVTDEDFTTQLNVNLRSPFILSQHAARAMMAQGRGGRIVNVSTVGVTAAHPDRAVYNLAKGGVETMTRNLALELAPHGITVNAVAPGNMVERPGNEVEVDTAEMAAFRRQIPVGRLGRGEDIAAAVRWFCLPEAAYTTGQTLLVDGLLAQYLREA